MFCNNCGQNIGNAKFCPNCGAPAQQSPQGLEATGTIIIRKANLNTLVGVGADVYVDGQFESTFDGKNRLTLTLPAGSHEVRLQIDDYADAIADVFVLANSASTYVLAVDERNKMTQLAKWEDPHTETAAPSRAAVPANRAERKAGGMVCSRCGGNNVQVQVIQENQGGSTITKTSGTMKEKRHGLLWWLFIGWWWWMVDLCLWIFAFPYRLIVGLFGKIFFPRKKKYTTNSTSVSTTSNRIVYKKVCTCQSCGYSWNI